MFASSTSNSKVISASKIDRISGRTIFGIDAVGYDHGRLDYPEALFDILEERCGLVPGCKILEIGAGSGQATRQLLARGAVITAVEPDPALVGLLNGSGSDANRLNVHTTTFEDVDLREENFDLGVAATSFGWLEPKTALSKIHAHLRPGGWWAMWWNIFRDVRGDPIFDTLLTRAARPESFASIEHYALDTRARMAELAAVGFEAIEYIPLVRTLRMTPARLLAICDLLSDPIAFQKRGGPQAR